MFKDKCILITGAAGSIGGALSHYLMPFKPSKLLLLDNAETPLFELEHSLKEEKGNVEIEFVLGSILNAKLIERLLNANKVDFVFHAAAYKHVPIIEKNPIPGVEVNVLGTKILADLSIKYDVGSFLFISTDKAVKPSNVMGATKAIAERYISALGKNQDSNTRFATVRFGNVIGSNGSVIPLFKEQIKKGGPLSITHKNASRYFINSKRVVSLLHKSLEIAESGDLLLFEMGTPKNIFKLAESTIIDLGHKLNEIEIIINGLRPGEKLNEELYSENSILRKTSSPDIHLVIEEEQVNLKQLTKVIDQLSKMIDSYDAIEVVKHLKRNIKSFKSENSEYETLD